jgi:hypothetical protein
MEGLQGTLDAAHSGIPDLILALERAMERYASEADVAAEEAWRALADCVANIASLLMSDAPPPQHGRGHNADLTRNREVSH